MAIRRSHAALALAVIACCGGSGVEPTPFPDAAVRGYWLRPEDAERTPVATFVDRGITDVFILSDRFGGERPYNTFIPAMVERYRGVVRVHAWIPVFRDENGSWVSPEDTAHRARILAILRNLDGMEGLHGIHLDYVRYPGTAQGRTDPVSGFLAEARTLTRKVLSAAVMPEMGANAEYYGQDYAAMAPHLDWVIPMAYKGNYRASDEWIGKVTAYVGRLAPGKVLTGIQTYRSDADTTPLTREELLRDIATALESGAAGFVLFRFGLSAY